MGGEMRTLCFVALVVCLVATLAGPAAARESTTTRLRATMDWSQESSEKSADPGLRGLYEEAAVDTYCIVWYDFEQIDWQGWTRVD